MLNSWIREAGGWWLTGLRSDLNPCGGTSLHLIVKLRVTQRSINCCLPRKRKSDEEMVSASFPYLFRCEVAFLRSGTSGGLFTVSLESHFVFCWAEALLLMASLPGSWHLLQPHSMCLPCLPGSPAEPCRWLLTTVAADTERLHCKFQGHSPCTHTPLRLVHWRQPQGTGCWLKHAKPPPETAYTPASEGTQLSGENWAWP